MQGVVLGVRGRGLRTKGGGEHRDEFEGSVSWGKLAWSRPLCGWHRAPLTVTGLTMEMHRLSERAMIVPIHTEPLCPEHRESKPRPKTAVQGVFFLVPEQTATRNQKALGDVYKGA